MYSVLQFEFKIFLKLIVGMCFGMYVLLFSGEFVSRVLMNVVGGVLLCVFMYFIVVV